MIDVTKMETEALVAENKAHLRKKAEITERQAAISTEVHKRIEKARAEKAAGLLTDDEIVRMGEAIQKSKEYREAERAKRN